MDPLELIARDPGVAPEFQAAVAPVRVSHAFIGSGGSITVAGPNRQAVEARAAELADTYPAEAYGTVVQPALQVGADWQVSIRWYGAD